MVVGADGKVEMRTVITDRAIGDRWLVDDGLKRRRQADRRGTAQICAPACRSMGRSRFDGSAGRACAGAGRAGRTGFRVHRTEALTCSRGSSPAGRSSRG